MSGKTEFDPVWEKKYAAGHAQRYPWDVVVSFVFRNAPRDKPRSDIRILEVGSGTGSNLWFAAREGFCAFGVEASASAIQTAQMYFAAEGVDVDLHKGSFTELPHEENFFDLVLDRGALTCCGFTSAAKAVCEIHRVLRPGGRFLFNPYSIEHSSAFSGRPGPDGVIMDITEGTLVGCGHLAFYSRDRIAKVLGQGWNYLSLQAFEYVEEMANKSMKHAEWRVVVEKEM